MHALRGGSQDRTRNKHYMWESVRWEIVNFLWYYTKQIILVYVYSVWCWNNCLKVLLLDVYAPNATFAAQEHC